MFAGYLIPSTVSTPVTIRLLSATGIGIPQPTSRLPSGVPTAWVWGPHLALHSHSVSMTELDNLSPWDSQVQCGPDFCPPHLSFCFLILDPV